MIINTLYFSCIYKLIKWVNDKKHKIIR
jgi:hypothetical protein